MSKAALHPDYARHRRCGAALFDHPVPQRQPTPSSAAQLRRAVHALYAVSDSQNIDVHNQAPFKKMAVPLGKRSNIAMKDAPVNSVPDQSIAAVLLAHRSRIIQFLRMRGAEDAAEDLYQDLWTRLSQRETNGITDLLSYVMRAANNLMLDRYRSHRQRDLRDQAWGELRSSTEAAAENRVIAQQQLELLDQAIEAVGDRPARIFRRFRLDGMAQKDIASEFQVSLSTVEADLRKVYAAIAASRRLHDV